MSPFFVIEKSRTEFLGSDGKIYQDRWVQDEFEVGYCWAPHNWLHMVLHCKRNRGLDKFVEKAMAHPGLGVFNGIEGSGHSVDAGGNLEVSPPVDVKTPAIPKGQDGPAVKPHRKAPFGKIILGDYLPRPCSDDYREFLAAQMVQPILPVDSSWLAVGHVDEILSFVRANDRKNFRLLFSGVRCMTIILKETKRVDRTATMHAGKYVHDGATYDEKICQRLAFWST